MCIYVDSSPSHNLHVYTITTPSSSGFCLVFVVSVSIPAYIVELFLVAKKAAEAAAIADDIDSDYVSDDEMGSAWIDSDDEERTP